jgi:chromosome segregation ATPase
MDNNGNADNSNSDIVNLALKALTEHEAATDRLIGKLSARKAELSTDMEKLNIAMEEVTRKLNMLENEIKKLKIILSI